VVKFIGFDATEGHRTVAIGGKDNLCPDPGLPKFKDRYVVRYPLREWGIDRAGCMRIIADAGLPVPPKSACFFCPAAKPSELPDLEPDELALALEMERLYQTGPHFHANEFKVRAVHRGTKEKIECVMYGESAAAVRSAFRRAHDDTRKPHAWAIDLNGAVMGLGRHWSWKDRLSLPVVELPLFANLTDFANVG
jgi:hypothetical protein